MTIKDLYETILEQNSESIDDLIIKTFETNQEFILNTDINDNKENYYYTTLLISLYANVLARKEIYSKALPFLNKAIPLWENNSVFEDVNLKNNWYECLRNDRGMASYNRRRFFKSMKDFLWLKNHFPEKDKYKIWLIAIVEKLLIYLGKVVVIIIAILYFKHGRNDYLSLDILLIAIVMVLWVLSVIRKKKKKRLTNSA